LSERYAKSLAVGDILTLANMRLRLQPLHTLANIRTLAAPTKAEINSRTKNEGLRDGNFSDVLRLFAAEFPLFPYKKLSASIWTRIVARLKELLVSPTPECSLSLSL